MVDVTAAALAVVELEALGMDVSVHDFEAPRRAARGDAAGGAREGRNLHAVARAAGAPGREGIVFAAPIGARVRDRGDDAIDSGLADDAIDSGSLASLSSALAPDADALGVLLAFFSRLARSSPWLAKDVVFLALDARVEGEEHDVLREPRGGSREAREEGEEDAERVRVGGKRRRQRGERARVDRVVREPRVDRVVSSVPNARADRGGEDDALAARGARGARDRVEVAPLARPPRRVASSRPTRGFEIVHAHVHPERLELDDCERCSCYVHHHYRHHCRLVFVCMYVCM